MVPHARTLRKARDNIGLMVIDGVSLRRVMKYLCHWCSWWRRTVASDWSIEELLQWLLDSCWRPHPAITYIAGRLHQEINTKTLTSMCAQAGLKVA